jgi:OFA family oxalate/formate antiporter-like MFS transporter
MPRGSIYRRFPIYYGWIIFLMTVLTYFFMYGLRYSAGVFFVPIQVQFGLTKAMTAGIVTIFFWVYGIFGMFVGRISNRIGVRKSILLGGLLLGAGGALSSLVNELWQLYVTWGVIAAVGASILYILPNMILARFFLKYRGKAIGWSSVGVSLGQAVLVSFAAWSIVKYGWRLTYIILGALVIMVVSFLGYLIFRESPESIGLEIDGGKPAPCESKHDQTAFEPKNNWTVREASATSVYKLMNVSYFFTIGGIISLLTFVVPHIIELGIDPLLASSAFGLIGIMSAVGSFIFGIVSDRIGRKHTIIVCAMGIATSMFVSTAIPPNITLLYAWVTLYGLTYGGLPEQYAAIVADYFGAKHGPSLFGIIFLAGAIGGGLFPLIGGYLADLTGSYHATLIFLGIGMCAAILTILPVKPLRRRGS